MQGLVEASLQPTQRPEVSAKLEVNPDVAYVKLLFENERIRVSDFRLPAGVGSVDFEAQWPTVRWQVDNGSHFLVVDGKHDVQSTSVLDKFVFFLEAGTTWQLSNTGAGTYRQIIFEILQPPKHTETQIQSLLKSATYSTDVGTKLLFENNFCRVWDFYLEPSEGGGSESVHHHVMDYVFVYVAPGRLLGYHHDGAPGLFDSMNNDNDVTWNSIPDSAAEDVQFAHGGKNGFENTPMREYLVELK